MADIKMSCVKQAVLGTDGIWYKHPLTEKQKRSKLHQSTIEIKDTELTVNANNGIPLTYSYSETNQNNQDVYKLNSPVQFFKPNMKSGIIDMKNNKFMIISDEGNRSSRIVLECKKANN